MTAGLTQHQESSVSFQTLPQLVHGDGPKKLVRRKKLDPTRRQEVVNRRRRRVRISEEERRGRPHRRGQKSFYTNRMSHFEIHLMGTYEVFFKEPGR